MKKIAISLMLLAAFPAAAQQQDYTPLQQYLYDQSGYAPPELAAQPMEQMPVEPYNTAYLPSTTTTVTIDNDSYYEEPDEGDVGPSSDESSLRGMLTSAGN